MGSRVPISNAVLRRRRRFFPAHSLIKWHPISVWKRRLVIGTYCYVIGIFRNSCRVAFFCLFFLCSSRNMAVERFFSHWFFFSNKFFKKYLFPPADEFLKMRKGKGACRCVCFFFVLFFLLFFFWNARWTPLKVSFEVFNWNDVDDVDERATVRERHAATSSLTC